MAITIFFLTRRKASDRMTVITVSLQVCPPESSSLKNFGQTKGALAARSGNAML